MVDEPEVNDIDPDEEDCVICSHCGETVTESDAIHSIEGVFCPRCADFLNIKFVPEPDEKD
jgi:formylmethanofuran dehydrogenase subunit E